MGVTSKYALRHDVKKSASHLLGLRAVFLHDAIIHSMHLTFSVGMHLGFMMENILTVLDSCCFRHDTDFIKCTDIKNIERYH